MSELHGLDHSGRKQASVEKPLEVSDNAESLLCESRQHQASQSRPLHELPNKTINSKPGTVMADPHVHCRPSSTLFPLQADLWNPQ